MISFLSIVAIFELNNVFKSKPNKLILSIEIIYLLIINYYAYIENASFILSITAIMIMLLMIAMTFDYINLTHLLEITFHMVYVIIPFSLILLLKNHPYIWLIFIISWGTDSFAYIVGVLLGKHKLCPKLSPNKTIEGAIGGILGSILLSLIFAYFMKFDIGSIILFSTISSIFAQLGDLSASKIKRISGIKDYGRIFGQHGGVLDRYDSILFVIPIIFLLYIITGGLQ